jgi:DNA-binding CsgD family transcriptional regulator
VSYAVALELRHWEAYLRGWRSMILLDQGDWTAAEDEALEICRRTNAADMYRFPALIALARLRVRRGDPDADIPLAAARHFAAGVAELQRSIYVAIIVAEKAWLAMSAEDDEAKRMLIEVQARAKERNTSWIIEDAALWLSVLRDRAPGLDAAGESVGEISKLSSPFREHCAGRWQEAAEGWRALGRPYEEALALSGGDDAAQRAALEILDRLGAMPAAARLRRQMRSGGSRAIPRGPIAMTRANAAGLTRRQVQVLGLLGEALSNAEIAARLCISAKTAEHHVSAIMARLGVSSRQEAAAAARDRGLLVELVK